MRQLTFIAMLLSLGFFSSARGDDLRTLPRELNDYCFRCHGEGKVKGKVDLVKAFAEKPHGLAGNLDLVEEITFALEDGDMPPEDERQPTDEQRARWVKLLNETLDAATGAQPAPTRVPMRRMNRFEYNNAVVALFQLNRHPFALPERTVNDFSNYFKPASRQMPQSIMVGNRALGKSQFLGKDNTLPGVAAFPRDNRAEHGFNNRADHLTMSPLLMESFFALSQSIVNSREFPQCSGVWKTLFLPPKDMPADQLVAEGRKRLAVFLRRAFRRDVDDQTIDCYTTRMERKLEQGRSFQESMKAAVAAAMVSPRFLYLYNGERGSESDEAAGRPFDDFDLASRLSFFIWSTIPDDQLLDLAASGKLSDSGVLAAQVDRMLDDPKLKNFCDSFPLQWLQLEGMISAVPDNRRYRPYYFSGANAMIYRVGMHMMLEPLLLFETVVIEDRPIVDLIDPGFTYESDMLKQWYRQGKGGRGEVVKIRFNRVELDDRRRGGVITNAAVMTMNAAPLRSKPIKRGAWLATVIFNDPPDPPPADVPEVDDNEARLKEEGLSLRDRLEAHIEDPNCAGCHRKIDPLGFALEHYDAVGRWREQYETGVQIDATGRLFGKHEFSDAVTFKDAIILEKERFTRAFAEHLLSYALGRELDSYDRPSIDGIMAASGKENHRMRSMIKQVVLSPSFRQIGVSQDR